MPTWNSAQYLKFSAERTRPAEDLAARIQIAAPKCVVDLGCGPGNSTAVVARRWPHAMLTGVDHSPAMIEAARASTPAIKWVTGDLSNWTADQPFDVVFSNAALQWVPDHTRVLPSLFNQVASGGAFAFQVPANFDAPAHRLMRELGAQARWQSHFRGMVREWHVEEPPFYYDLLAPLARHLDLWVTDYQHILDGPDAIVEWYQGTGLRPWLEALSDDSSRDEFTADYRTLIAQAFRPQRDGCVIFPFRRLFVIAYR